MLVHSHSHLIPQADGSPTAYSSQTTSAYIPHISYEDLAHAQDIPPFTAASAHRQERRMRTAPYPLSVATSPVALSALASSDTRHAPEELYTPLSAALHSPRPVQSYNPVHALDMAGANMATACNISRSSPCTGAHGTIFGSFASQSESISTDAQNAELAATQVASMPASSIDDSSNTAYTHPSPSATPPTRMYPAMTPQARRTSSLPQIQLPRARHVPQLPQIQTNDFHLSPADFPSNPPPLPLGAASTASDLHAHPADKIPPPQNTFPTPSELLSELTARDRDMQKDQKRAKRRKAQQDEIAKSLGYSPTDPDTISSHDKKRYYLDCLEQYVLYLHSQLRLVGVEPVPVERVSSGRGLTSRSIRTMIVHMQKCTSKMHNQKMEAEIKYEELRAEVKVEMDRSAIAGGFSDTNGWSLGRRHSFSHPMSDPGYAFP
ncbi:hypothetical protein M0805_004207 [Coniferiporia weirii]|nr:hypothetical protein M0805_004207 [Coniferiporia weirii]